MDGRPEWIVCVDLDHRLEPFRTWCGRATEGEFVFAGATHAALYGRTKGRLVTCPDCVDKIVEALCEGFSWVPDAYERAFRHRQDREYSPLEEPRSFPEEALADSTSS